VPLQGLSYFHFLKYNRGEFNQNGCPQHHGRNGALHEFPGPGNERVQICGQAERGKDHFHVCRPGSERRHSPVVFDGISKTKNARVDLNRVMKRSQQLIVEMEKAVKGLNK